MYSRHAVTNSMLIALLPVFFATLSVSMFVDESKAHDPNENREADRSDYPARAARVEYLQQYKMSSGLGARATYKVKRASLEAAGLTQTATAQLLYGGPSYAFPYITPPELKSTGDQKTLTVLVDFEDYRAGISHPPVNDLIANIYGDGTSIARNYFPYESARNYYHRASEGLLNLQGSVLGWHSMPNNRASYEPGIAPDGPNQRSHQMYLDNLALFEIADSILSNYDETHDFSQYDNDNDGDIDLLTILYAGPASGWGSFWWAYRWEFFVPEASYTRYDGKAINQFVFQFIDTRRGTSDFDPTTLIHEIGHALGLADYYDYDPNRGETGGVGGVGGLDMMDGNWGNHSAFSRWLLDWIQPTILGSETTIDIPLLASGASTGEGTKAVAVFPELSDLSAPTGEMFIIENRHQVGNDGGTARTPGNGILIWHIDAAVNSEGTDFKYDNSFTVPKLLKLVRANSRDDFVYGGTYRADAGTYFTPGTSFTPYSDPASHRLNGSPSRVSVKGITEPGEVLGVQVSIAPSDTDPAVSPTAPRPRSEAVLPTRDQYSIDLDRLETLSMALASATTGEIERYWESLKPSHTPEISKSQDILSKQIALMQWARKSGEDALSALLEDKDPGFVSRTFPQIMDAWVDVDPAAAGDWYFSEEHSAIRNSEEYSISHSFAEKVLRFSALVDHDKALQQMSALVKISDLNAALSGYIQGLSLEGLDKTLPTEDIQKLGGNGDLVLRLEAIREAVDSIQLQLFDNPRHRAELEKLLVELPLSVDRKL